MSCYSVIALSHPSRAVCEQTAPMQSIKGAAAQFVILDGVTRANPKVLSQVM